MKKAMIKTIYLIAGLLSVLVGVIGIFLPLLPTTPFILLAAFCFSRSSEKLHQYLINHKLFGKIIRDWEDFGIIPLQAKIIATSMMLLMVSYPLIFKEFHLGLKAMVVVTIVIGVTYIWTRPSKPLLKAG